MSDAEILRQIAEPAGPHVSADLHRIADRLEQMEKIIRQVSMQSCLCPKFSGLFLHYPKCIVGKSQELLAPDVNNE